MAHGSGETDPPGGKTWGREQLAAVTLLDGGKTLLGKQADSLAWVEA